MSRADQSSRDLVSQISTHLRRECWHELFLSHGAGLPENIRSCLKVRVRELRQQIHEQKSEQERMAVADSHPAPLQVINYRRYLPHWGLEVRTKQQEYGTMQMNESPSDAVQAAQRPGQVYLSAARLVATV